VGAFGGGIQNSGVLDGFYTYDFGVRGLDFQAGHTVGAGVVGLPRNHGGVGYDGGFVEFFFAALVWTPKLFMLVSMEKLHAMSLQLSYLERWRFNKRCLVCGFWSYCTTQIKQAPFLLQSRLLPPHTVLNDCGLFSGLP
jgi:hypothetical protein